MNTNKQNYFNLRKEANQASRAFLKEFGYYFDDETIDELSTDMHKAILNIEYIMGEVKDLQERANILGNKYQIENPWQYLKENRSIKSLAENIQALSNFCEGRKSIT